MYCTRNGCKLDSHSGKLNISYFHFSCSVEFRHSTASEFAGEWETKCLNTRFPLSTVLHTTVDTTALLLLVQHIG